MCQDTGTAIVMGKRGQQVLTEGDDERDLSHGIFDAYQKLNLRYSQLSPLSMWQERNTGSEPARTDRALREHPSRSGAAVRLPVHGQGRRQRQQELPLPGDGGPAEPRVVRPLPRREAARHRHRGLPALPPRDRRRRHQRGVRAQDRQVRERPLLRHPPGPRLRRGSRLPRPRDGAAGPRDDAALRHRRAVRRQVLLPRRARHPAAAARRLVPGGDRGVVLGRPAGEGTHHPRGRLPRAARDRAGALPARGDRRAPRRRRRAHRPQPADGRDPPAALPPCPSAPASR